MTEYAIQYNEGYRWVDCGSSHNRGFAIEILNECRRDYPHEEYRIFAKTHEILSV